MYALNLPSEALFLPDQMYVLFVPSCIDLFDYIQKYKKRSLVTSSSTPGTFVLLIGFESLTPFLKEYMESPLRMHQVLYGIANQKH